jgi:hypothetical protein
MSDRVERWNRDRIQQVGWIAANCALLIAVSMYAFRRNLGWLFPGGDGSYAIDSFINQTRWTTFSLGFFANPLQGLGDIQLPINTWLVPSYLLSTLILGPDSRTTPLFQIVASSIFALELFVATFCLARALGIAVMPSLAAAWMTPVLVLPYFGVPLLYPLLLFGPAIGTIIADCLLGMATIAWLGRVDQTGNRSPTRDVVLCCILILLLAHITLLAPAFAIICAPVIALAGLGLIAGAHSVARRAKVIASVIAIVLLTASGFAFFVWGLFEFTVPRLLGARLQVPPVLNDWQFVSNWFYVPAAVVGKTLITAALFGLAIALCFGDRAVRFFAIAVGSMMAIIFGFGAMAVGKDLWRLPSLVYYEMFVVPLYAIFAAYGVAKTLGWLYNAMRQRRFRPVSGDGRGLAATLPFILIIPCVVYFAARQVNNTERVYGPYPPANTPLVSILKQEIGLTPGSAFRGRVASFFMVNTKGPVGWLDLVGGNAKRVAATGNDYLWSGLWPNQIPTLFQYSPLISPAFFLTAVRLLGNPTDLQLRNVIVLRRPDARALALLGVRFVISDVLLQSPFRLVIAEKTFDNETLYLYEEPNPNLGNNTPVQTVRVHNFDEALARLVDQQVDPTTTAVVFDEIPRDFLALVPAQKVALKVEKDGLVVQAKSSGASMVVLPFEYSRCLTLRRSDAMSAVPKLLRVNAMEIGVLFERQLDAKISYFTGPFSGAGCRLGDKQDFIDLSGSNR